MSKITAIRSKVNHVNNLFETLAQISLLFFVNKMIENVLGLIDLDFNIQNLKLFFKQFCDAWKSTQETFAWNSWLLFLQVIIGLCSANKWNYFLQKKILIVFLKHIDLILLSYYQVALDQKLKCKIGWVFYPVGNWSLKYFYFLAKSKIQIKKLVLISNINCNLIRVFVLLYW